MKSSSIAFNRIVLGIALVFGAPAIAMADDMKKGSTEMDSEQPVTDTWITTKVKADLATTDGIDSTDISVDTVNGVVTLTGMQPNSMAVKKAVAVAEGIKGVTKVNASSLTVARSGNGESAETDSDQPVTDTWITTKVKADLATTEGIESTEISVDTVNGVVTLTGVQPSKMAVEKAVAVAKGIKGVVKVDASALNAK
ncbi:BON domain-containing protein [Dokdonella sp.]|uniref:BON domain-containing protein n=1 Tax=Dokdonella sp. TaxID=2291710 RepID=UPI003C4FB8DB